MFCFSYPVLDSVVVYDVRQHGPGDEVGGADGEASSAAEQVDTPDGHIGRDEANDAVAGDQNQHS